MSIPKKIHYCWFGKTELPDKVKKCIASWEKYCPDYQVICWNEDSYDIASKCDFVKMAYQAKKWAFVSDYARIDVVYAHGGVYLDTDVELIKPLDALLEEGAFIGFEEADYVATGLGFAAEKGDRVLECMLERYRQMKFSVDCLNAIKCPLINTAVLQEFGMRTGGEEQRLDCGWHILPKDVLCPINLHTGKCHITENTISIHHYDASWQSPKEYRRNQMIMQMKRILPLRWVQKLRHLFQRMRKNNGKKI